MKEMEKVIVKGFLLNFFWGKVGTIIDIITDREGKPKGKNPFMVDIDNRIMVFEETELESLFGKTEVL